MLLGALVKVVTAVAGGASAIGTPFLVKHLTREEKTISLELSGKKNCKALITSLDENKMIAVCGENTPLEFFYIKDTSKMNETQKVIAFGDKQWTRKDLFSLKFSIESTSRTNSSATETIKVSQERGNKLQMLKEADLSSCNWFQTEEISCSAKDNQLGYHSSVSVKLATKWI